MTSSEYNYRYVEPMTNAEKVSEFHTAMGMTNRIWPPTEEEIELRKKLIKEEWIEVQEETHPYYEGNFRPEYLDKTKIAKELADLLYVTYGTAVSFGIPIDEVFAEVHKSNMSKLVDGKPVKREDGKVLKGPNYQPPQLEHIFK